MSNAAHTPGLWSASRSRGGRGHGPRRIEINGPQHEWVANVKNHALGAQGEANARLIAAAPELIEALQYLDREGWLANIERQAASIERGDRALSEELLASMAKVRAAIAKATGSAP